MSETLLPQPEAGPPATPKRPCRGCLVACGVIVFLLTGLFIGTCSVRKPAIRPQDYSHLQTLGRALDAYAHENEGRLPPTLFALAPEDISEAGFADNRYSPTREGERFDWLYFPKENYDKLPNGTILIASPSYWDRGDGKVVRLVWGKQPLRSWLPEADFQRLIREQNPPAPRAP